MTPKSRELVHRAQRAADRVSINAVLNCKCHSYWRTLTRREGKLVSACDRCGRVHAP